MRVSDYLARAARTPFAWGSHDCLLWLAEWAMLNGHADGGVRWRGHYRTALGCQRLVKREGGMVAVLAQGASEAGVAPIDISDTRPGDIAVGALGPTKWEAHLTGLIRTGIGWAALGGSQGVLVGPADPLAAWRI